MLRTSRAQEKSTRYKLSMRSIVADPIRLPTSVCRALQRRPMRPRVLLTVPLPHSNKSVGRIALHTSRHTSIVEPRRIARQPSSFIASPSRSSGAAIAAGRAAPDVSARSVKVALLHVHRAVGPRLVASEPMHSYCPGRVAGHGREPRPRGGKSRAQKITRK